MSKPQPIMKYIDALKIWNSGKDKWCFVRRGTPEYEIINKIRFGEQLSQEDQKQFINRKKKQMPIAKLENILAEVIVDIQEAEKVNQQAGELRAKQNLERFEKRVAERKLKGNVYKLPDLVLSKRQSRPETAPLPPISRSL